MKPFSNLSTLDPQMLLSAQEPLLVEPHTVHAWCFKLYGAPDTVGHCRGLLSAHERNRADRFVFEHDRTHYTVAHGVLRALLARYCGVAPAALVFEASAAGKPTLVSPATRLRFNLTHSHDRGLIGVTMDRELGVDLERVRLDIEALSISRHYFFGTEREAIEAAPPFERENAFFRYWVAKEAVLKAEGIGLGFALDRFQVAFSPAADTATIDTLDPVALSADWTVRMLPCETGWFAAVAARGTDWVVRLEAGL
jgi:4'-phosphopantetheinyl transferase